MEEPTVSTRPWGEFVKFCENEKTTVKIIKVKAGHSLSYKKHTNRDEMWIALDQGLIALVGDETIFMRDVAVGEYPIWIPRGTLHSVKNVNEGFDVRFMEISFGDFDESDMERIRDNYGRI